MSTPQDSIRLGEIQQRYTQAREAQWREKYGLVRTDPSRTAWCLRSLLGKHCLAVGRILNRRCDAHITSLVADHGRYYRRPRERHALLFLGQPYRATPAGAQEEVQAICERLGLYWRIGATGEGWYNSATYPIVISHEPIPTHGFVCDPYDDSIEHLLAMEREGQS